MAGTPEHAEGAIEVVRVDDRHIPALAQFFRATWDPDAAPEQVRRARASAAATNPAAGGEDIATFILLSHGRAIGHIGTIPVSLWDGSTERRADWLKGLMVLPEHRNGPVGYAVLKAAVAHAECGMAMVVQPAPRRLFGAFGYTDLGALPNYLRLLRVTRVLRRLDIAALGFSGLPRWTPRVLALAGRPGIAHVAGAGLRAAFQIYAAARSTSFHRLRVESPATVDWAEIDALWLDVRGQLAAAVARSAAYLKWRYADRADAAYRMITARDAAGLTGLAVVRPPGANGDPRLRGIRVATLSDLLFRPERAAVGLALIRSAERVAVTALDADAILCSASHRSVVPLLRKRAFVPLPGNVHFLIRDTAARNRLPGSLDEWWLTRGDSDADEPF